MTDREIGLHALRRLKEAGAQKAAAVLSFGEKKELNVEVGRMTLLRTTFDASLGLLALSGDRKGTTSINKMDSASVDAAAERAMALAGSSKADPANEIAEAQPATEFSCGPESPDLDLMYDRLREFLDGAGRAYPNTILESAILEHRTGRQHFLNSNGVDFLSRTGSFGFQVMFTTKAGGKSTSFNFAGFSAADLGRPLRECARVDALLEESSRQLETKPVPEKFLGDIIATPDCLDDFLGFLTGNLGDYPLITGTSVYKDKLGRKVASDRITVHARPLAPELASRYFVTGDGYPARDATVVDHGVLRTFLLSLYGARKTGKERAVNGGGCWIVEGGDAPYADMVRSVERGVLVCRFSGGNPGANGDFSGIAKNSWYIRDGRIAWPLSETMISGNLASMLLDVKDVSRETVNFGSAVAPWVRFGGVTVSGK